MNFNFRNKVVLVTGGTRGIGKAIAIAFARRNAHVIANYVHNEKAAEATFRELLPGKHSIMKADISDADEVRKLVNQVIAEYGKIDILINNAGISIPHPVDKVNYGDWRKAWETTINTNLLAPANLCYCVAQYMIHEGGGRIINISSRGAFRGEPTQVAYGASKAALNAMSQSLAQALAPHRIFVGCVAPAFVETDRTKKILDGPRGPAIKSQSPLGRVAKAEEVANAALFLASEGTEFMTGTIIDVNGASYLR